jgi:hypothetical protein
MYDNSSILFDYGAKIPTFAALKTKISGAVMCP